MVLLLIERIGIERNTLKQDGMLLTYAANSATLILGCGSNVETVNACVRVCVCV